MAIGRACRDGRIPHFGPHALRHRRISILHNGVSWAEIGERVGQRSRLVTADTYSHAMIDASEVDRAKLLERVRMVQTSVQTSDTQTAAFAGVFYPSPAHREEPASTVHRSRVGIHDDASSSRSQPAAVAPAS